MRASAVRSLFHGLCLAAAAAGALRAQTDYRNLDAGRPLRVEDALVTPRWALDLQLPSARVERFASVDRWRLDPKATFGVAPFTEIELRLPVLYVVPRAQNATRSAGLAGVAVGAVHAFTLETPRVPGIAVGSEVLLPAGGLAAPRTSYALKVIATKTLPLLRVHLNAVTGNYSVRGSSQPLPDTACVPGVNPGCGGSLFIPDVPCYKGPTGSTPSLSAATSLASLSSVPRSESQSMCATGIAPSSALQVTTPGTNGYHWLAAMGIDHAFGLSSMLIGADVLAERFVGLYGPIDWTAEAGVRRQLTPQLLLDAAVARHFLGTLQSTAFTVGGAYAFSLAR
jgi:hypothetical protein